MVKNRYVTKVWTVSHISVIVNRACVKTNVDDIPMSCVTEIADADLLNGHRVKCLDTVHRVQFLVQEEHC